MNSSGIKRGLAVSAVAALGVVGIPGLAHAADGNAYSVGISASPSSVVTYQNDVLSVSTKDSSGNAVASETVNVTITETDPNASATESAADKASPFLATGLTGLTTADSAGGKWTETATVTTDSKGVTSFKLASKVAGTVSVAITDGAATNNTSFTVSGGKSYAAADAAAATKSLQLSSTSVTEYTGDWTATDGKKPFTVLALDGSSQPVGGTTIQYAVTDSTGAAVAGGTSTITTPSPSAASDANPYAANGPDLSGVIKAKGTYTVKLWVNNSAAGTPVADSGEPTATYTVTLADAPTGHLDNTGAYTHNGIAASSVTYVGGTTPELPADAKDTTVPLAVKVLGTDGKPLADAHVRFDVKIGTADAKPFEAVTDSNGVASVTPAVTAAQAVDGTTVQVEAFLSQSPNVGTGTPLTDTDADGAATEVLVATFKNRAYTITFAGQGSKVQATKGGTVSVPVVIKDQFGAAPTASQQLAFQVTAGDNKSDSKTVQATDASGKTTFTYQDVKATGNPDKVTVTDLTSSATALTDFEVDYIAGATTAAKVEFTTDPTKVSDPTTLATPAASATNTSSEYTVTVTNSNGDKLINSLVTFSVNQGFVEDANDATNKGTTIQVYTDNDGTASVKVGSTKAGSQTLSAADGSATASSANPVVYTAALPYNVSFTTAPSTITAGDSARYIALVTDEWGNPVNGSASLDFEPASNTQPGYIDWQGTNGTVDKNGNAVAVIGTLSSDSGNGALVATPYSGGWAAKDADAEAHGATVTYTDPAGDGVTAAYTVTAPVVTKPTKPTPAPVIKVKAAGAKSVGKNDVVTIKLANANGKVAKLVKAGKVIKKATVRHGKVTFKVKDTNGKKVTRYVVRIGHKHPAVKTK